MDHLLDVPYALGEDQAYRTASLARCASIVARKLYASLPRGLRVVNLFIKLADASSGIETFGRVMYAEFIKKGVKGLPPIHGKPVEEVIKNPNAPNLATLLPRNYGGDLGRKAYGSLLQMGLSPEVAADTMQEFAINFLTKSPIEEGSNVHEAEHFTLRGLRMFGMTRRRSENRHRRRETPSLVKDDDGEDVVHDIKDEGIFDAVSNMVSADYMNRMVKHLDQQLKSRIGDDVIPRYFELSLEEGVDDKRMIQDNLLPLTKYKGVSGWNNFKTKFLYPAALEYFMSNPPSDDFKKRLDRYLAR